MSKQDRQGVRTPAELEQKYNFGSSKKAVAVMMRTLAGYDKTISELRLQMALLKHDLEEMGREFILAVIVGTGAGWELHETDYATLKAAFDGGKAVTVYIDHNDGSRRYYHCMGTCVYNGVDGLLFQYGFGNTVQIVFIGADESVTVEGVTLAKA